MKIDKHIKFNVDDLEYLRYVKKKHNLSSISSALDKVINDVRNKSKKEKLTDKVINQITENIKSELKKVKLDTSSSDKNSQITLLLLNQLLLYSNMKIYRNECSNQLKEAKRIIEDKIQGFETRKSTSERRKQTFKDELMDFEDLEELF